jgi:hypothetical protein
MSAPRPAPRASELYAAILRERPTLGANGFVSDRHEPEVLEAERRAMLTPEFAQTVAFSLLHMLTVPPGGTSEAMLLALQIADDVGLPIRRGAVLVAADLLGHEIVSCAGRGAGGVLPNSAAPGLPDDGRAPVDVLAEGCSNSRELAGAICAAATLGDGKDLDTTGFHTGGDRHRPERQEVFSSAFGAEVVRALVYLGGHAIPAGSMSSEARAAAEEALGKPVSHGAFIMAALICGYEVLRHDDSPWCLLRLPHNARPTFPFPGALASAGGAR